MADSFAVGKSSAVSMGAHSDRVKGSDQALEEGQASAQVAWDALARQGIAWPDCPEGPAHI
eukprot:12275312-Prorocentrum_lima.AAC.1